MIFNVIVGTITAASAIGFTRYLWKLGAPRKDLLGVSALSIAGSIFAFTAPALWLVIGVSITVIAWIAEFLDNK